MFISWVQGYYGNYPAGQKKDILEYLSEYDDIELDAIRDVLKHDYPSRYKIPPDIYELDRIKIIDLVKTMRREKGLPIYKEATENQKEITE
jgi:hypothetical protein